MSSKLGDYAGRFAVDGIYKPENDVASLAHTEADSNPWIQIDLSQSYCISAVKVWNRYLSSSANRMSITFTVLYILLLNTFLLLRRYILCFTALRNTVFIIVKIDSCIY